MLSKIENGRCRRRWRAWSRSPRAQRAADQLFATYEERRDCSYVAAGNGVTIERRGTKAGHQYQLLGHSISGNLVVEPYLITLSDEAEPYPVFQHAGIESIYMLTGAVSYRHADKSYPLTPGDALIFDARPRTAPRS